MLDLYRNIKERRLALGLTQGELAKRTGYSDKSMIAKIEAGKVDLPQSKIVAFAKALATDPGDLLGESPAADLVLTDEEREIIEAFRLADDFDRETVRRALGIRGKNNQSSEKEA